MQQYATRILIVPEGGAARWLFKTPWLLGVLGLAVVVFLRRMRHAVPEEEAATARAD